MAEQVFQQDRSQEAPDYHHLLWMQLLFEEQPQRPAPEAIQAALAERFGEVDIVSSADLCSFAVRRFPVQYSNADVPAQVLMAMVKPFEADSISDLERSQLWDLPEKEEFLARFRYGLMLSDFMASGLSYKERCSLLTGWLETALDLFPDCIGVWVPSAGKLLNRKRLLENPLQGEDRFLWYGVNARFFDIQNSDNMIMDTLGLYAIGLPDVQLHFHTVDPNPLANYLYNVAQYLYDNNCPIKPGETIDGVGPDGSISRELRWTCAYEHSLLQPARDVLDICPGPFAAGRRSGKDKKGNFYK